MADTKPPSNVTVRTRWGSAEEAQLADLLARKEKAYKEGVAGITEVLAVAGVDATMSIDGIAKALIPVSGQLRDALAPFDEKVSK